MNSVLGNRQGFTLVEVIIAISIFVIVMLAFFNLYLGYSNIYNSQQQLFNIAVSASGALNEMQNLILQADKVVQSYNFSGTIYSSTATTLVIELPSTTSGGDIVVGKYDYVAIYTTGTKAYRLILADPASSRISGLKQLSDTVLSLTFTYDTSSVAIAKKVDIDMQTQGKTGLRTQTYHLHQQVYLRNY
jgi:prepilin-type N-terminal cleavage/methylation domain-containing protein